jgi:hypothetical protein
MNEITNREIEKLKEKSDKLQKKIDAETFKEKVNTNQFLHENGIIAVKSKGYFFYKIMTVLFFLVILGSMSLFFYLVISDRLGIFRPVFNNMQNNTFDNDYSINTTVPIDNVYRNTFENSFYNNFTIIVNNANSS